MILIKEIKEIKKTEKTEGKTFGKFVDSVKCKSSTEKWEITEEREDDRLHLITAKFSCDLDKSQVKLAQADLDQFVKDKHQDYVNGSDERLESYRKEIEQFEKSRDDSIKFMVEARKQLDARLAKCDDACKAYLEGKDLNALITEWTDKYNITG